MNNIGCTVIAKQGRWCGIQWCGIRIYGPKAEFTNHHDITLNLD